MLLQVEQVIFGAIGDVLICFLVIGFNLTRPL